MNFDSC